MRHDRLILLTAVASALCIAGCADDAGTYRAPPPHDQLDDPYRTTYSPVPGHTTGGGLPRDMRTGGGITGSDVPPSTRLEKERMQDLADEAPQ